MHMKRATSEPAENILPIEMTEIAFHEIISRLVAAAVEGAFLGKPAVAVSLHLSDDVEPAFDWAAKLASGWQ